MFVHDITFDQTHGTPWFDDAAHRALRRVGLDRPLEIERVRTADTRYVLRVPVLAVDGAELDAAGLEDGAIARWLAEIAPR